MKKKRRKKKKPYHRRNFKNRRVRRAGTRENDPFYIEWRTEVKDRDGRVCQWPGCSSKHLLEAHHIKTWAKYPALRYCRANGITLCRKHHSGVRNKEEDFEMFFYKILEWKMIKKIKTLASE